MIDAIILNLVGITAVAVLLGLLVGKDGATRTFGIFWFWWFGFGISFWGWIIYVVIHFVQKFW